MASQTHKWFVVVNPVAGGGRGLDDFPRYRSSCARRRSTTSPPSPNTSTTLRNSPWRRSAGLSPHHRGGGDGTLHEVVNGLFIQNEVRPDEVLLAVIAVGTGNDWVRTVGIPERHRDAIRAIAEECCFLQDVGVVSYEESHYRQSRCMVNVAGAGFDAQVVRRVSHLQQKARLRRWSYTWCLLRSFFGYKSTGVKVWVDDKLVYNDLLLSVAIGICQYNGGGIRQLPEAVADDGLLDVSLIRPIHFWHVLFRFATSSTEASTASATSSRSGAAA